MNAAHTSVLIASLVLGAQSTHALAAPDDPTPGSPAQVEQAIAILPRVGTNQTAVMPTKAAVSVAVQPGLTQGEDWLKVLHDTLDATIAPSTLAQGAYILNRPGTIVRGPNNLLIFVPDQATRQPGEGPVLLMPCHTLEQLENQWTGQPIELSGEIFTYHNRNQLLISAYRIGKSQPIENPPESTTTQPGDTTPPSTENDPGVRDLLKELEFDTQSNASPTQSPHLQIDSPSNSLNQRTQVTRADSITGFDEGTLILRQPSRMIRNASGAWVIVFDNDTPDATNAPELIVEPCKLLMRMETIAMDAGDATQLLVSGRIYTYKGLHYILPTLVQRLPAQELNSMQ